MAGVSRPAKTFTPRQGQYLAFIHLYTRLHRRPPAETEMQDYFRVSPPSVHQMVLTLERAGFIRRQPRTARSIELLVDPTQLQSYFDPGFNRSRSLCRGTRRPLVQRSRLISGSCPSTRTFAPRFLQTPPRGDSPCASLTLHLHQVG